MSWIPTGRRLFEWPRRSSSQIRRDVDDELAHHLELAADELVRCGWTREEARLEARRRFGDLDGARDAMIADDRRFERRRGWQSVVRSVREDLAFAVRSYARRPGHTVVSLATLTLGITTATIFFGAVDSILLQPVALDDPDRVVQLFATDAARAGKATSGGGLAPATVRDIGERSRSFTAVGAAQPHAFDVAGPDGPVAVNSWIVSPGYFEVLRTRPAVGRLLGPGDFEGGAEPALVITHAFWMSRLGADPEAVGTTLALDGTPHVLVGVLPPDFPVRDRELFVPRAAGSGIWESRSASFFSAFGRLRADVSIDAARAELDEVAGALARDYPEANEGRGLTFVGLRASLVGDTGQTLWILFAAAVLILVIACVNAAGLILARAVTRTRELAIRAAVGAGHGRLMRQMLTETVLLATVAGAIAVPLAAAGLGLFRALSPPTIPRIDELALDPSVIAFATLTAFAVALLVGLVPAARVSRPDLYEVLKPGGRSGTLTPGTTSLRALLVGAEVAIAIVLLVGGGLLLRSWVNVLDTEQGYTATGVAAIEAHYWQFHEDGAGRAEFARLVTERLASVPGVEAAAAATSLPLAEPIGNEDGELARPEDARPTTARWLAVTPGYFAALGIELVAGRQFGEADRPDAEPVVLLSREAMRRLWPDDSADAVGRTVLVGDDGAFVPHRIVGVVEDTRYAGLELDPEPVVYAPHAQAPVGSVYFVVRTDGGSGLAIIRDVLAELQPSLVASGRVSLADAVAAAGRPRRFNLMLLTAFALTALFLTVVGLFGHLSGSIQSREHEFGVRMALGAWPARLVRAVVGQGVTLVLAGATGGLLLAFGLARFMDALLYEVPTSDPLTFLASVLLVLAIGVAASYLPARRIARVDPAVALRVE